MILLCLFCLTGIAAQAQEEGPADNQIWYIAPAKLAEINLNEAKEGLHKDNFAMPCYDYRLISNRNTKLSKKSDMAKSWVAFCCSGCWKRKLH